MSIEFPVIPHLAPKFPIAFVGGTETGNPGIRAGTYVGKPCSRAGTEVGNPDIHPAVYQGTDVGNPRLTIQSAIAVQPGAAPLPARLYRPVFALHRIARLFR